MRHTTKTFQPKPSDRYVNLAGEQRWQADDGTVIGGADLAKRLLERGTINSVQYLLDTPVGGCVKTGVSAYERTA